MATYAIERQYGTNSGPSYAYKGWNRQPKPYSQSLAYMTYVNQTTDSFDSYVNPAGSWHYEWGNLPQYDRTSVDNVCADRLQAAISDKANLAVALAERKQTIDMVVKRVSQITNVVRDIKKGRFTRAAKHLGIKQPKGAKRSKQFADNFLEFHFGWSPLIGDLFSAAKVLSGPPPTNPVKARGKGTFYFLDGWPLGSPPGSGQYRTCGYRVQSGVRVKMENPDLFLLNQFGLTNPAVVLWEAIPFSFVVDWFTDFGSYLESLTGLLGVSLHGGYTSRSTATTTQVAHWISPNDFRPYWWVDTASGRCNFFQRTPGHLTAVPTFKLQRFSVTRGITAVSLLLQQLHNRR